MKRENKPGKVVNLKWRNISANSPSLLIGGKRRIIKPKETFEAKESEVPVAFRDVIVCLNKEVIQMEVASIDGVDQKPYQKVEIEDGFNIVDAEGTIMNEIPLSEEEADAELQELLKGGE